jgi:hypothetical protein
MNKTILFALGILVGFLIGFMTLKSDANKPKFEYKRLIGVWDEPDDKSELKIKSDSTFQIYLSGSQQNFYGKYRVFDVVVDLDTSSFLVLKNAKLQEFRNEDYFEYYFLEIESVSNNTMRLIDRSGKLRMNRKYKFKRDD